MIDQAFCELLEYEIYRALENSDLQETKGFWCDGVLMSKPERYYSQNIVKHNRQMEFKAFVGKTGQTEYAILLKLGEHSLREFAKTHDIKEHFSFADKKNAFNIDIKSRQIEIQLD